MTQIELADSPAEEAERIRNHRRNPAPYILLVVGVVLVGYYAFVAISGVLVGTTAVPIRGGQQAGGDHLTLHMRTEEIDLTNRLIYASVMPIPHGALVGDRPGEISQSLRIAISSGGVTTEVVTFPGQSTVDSTAITLVLNRGDNAYPFDKPVTDFQISVLNDQTGEPVPFALTMENSARPWVLSGRLSPPYEADGKVLVDFTIDGARDALSIILVLFYLLALLLTTLMAVVTIGTALVKRRLGFDNVIWLSATMLSFPAMRSAMPGAPPIGTAMDYIAFFPCMALIAGMLVWTGLHLLWRESSILRTRHVDDDEADGVA